MTQPLAVDPAMVAAVLAALQAQGVVVLGPPPQYGGPTRVALCCRLCGHELADQTWHTYLAHCAANHHSLVVRFAEQVDGTDLDLDLAAEVDPAVDAWTVLADELAAAVPDWPVNSTLHLEQRTLPVGGA